MSGGQLVVLDRGGREVKYYPLASGMATLGSHPRCNIRVMQPAVSAHHATLVVHAAQTVVRNVGDGTTLVNGSEVSVAALRHGDVLTVGDRTLRWEYAEPSAPRPLTAEPALVFRGRKGRAPRRASASAIGGSGRSPSLQLALEMQHRASMPGNAGGKQVAIVQPQRRDTTEQNDQPKSPRSNAQNKRQRFSLLDEAESTPQRKSLGARQAQKTPLASTKAELWIESRKTSPRKTFKQSFIPRPGSSRKPAPLRTAVLKKVHSAQNINLTKIAAPLKIDHTKQAAIMLMTGHTPKSKLPSPKHSIKKTPSFVVKKPSPIRKTPKARKSSGKTTPRNSATNSASKKASSTPVTARASATTTSRATRGRATLNDSAPNRGSATPVYNATITEDSPIRTSRGRATVNDSVTRYSATPLTNATVEDDTPIRTSRGRATINDSATRHGATTLSNATITEDTPVRSRGRATINDSATRYGATPLSNATITEDTPIRISRGRATINDSVNSSIRDSPRLGGMITTSVKPSGNVTKGSVSLSTRKTVSPKSSFTPKNSPRKSSRGSGSQLLNSDTIINISDSTGRESTRRSRLSTRTSPLLPSPKKSALKDPSAKPNKKNESIKFDLSNLENYDDTEENLGHDDSLNELTLRYSDTSSLKSPSPRKSIHSRSSKILEKSLGESLDNSLTSLASQSSIQRSKRNTLTPRDTSRRSSRASFIVQKSLENSGNDRYSRRTTKSLTDNTSAPQSPNRNLETYSIVDLVSMDDESVKSGSVYSSANSSAIDFGTPQNSIGRKTRSTIDPSLVESSTPYVGRVARKSRSTSNPGARKSSIRNASQFSTESSNTSRRSKSLTTPNDTSKISVNSTKISRTSRSKSRVNDTDLLLVSDISQTDDDSPRSSKKKSVSESPKAQQSNRKGSVKSSPVLARKSSRKSDGNDTPANDSEQGLSTPENRHSPEEVGTPVLSIQNLLDSSQNSFSSKKSQKRGRFSTNINRKTIGVLRSAVKRAGTKSKSLSFTARRGLLRLSRDSDPAVEDSQEKMVTPKSAIKLVQEAVKNKHSTAKKPQSKRSIIDNLDESDIVKQLFNSPVKRKLSQSMTEFSRKQLFDDNEIAAVRRPTRNTIALTGRSPDNSLLEHTEAYTPERFVSPISTPSESPNVSGIKRSQKNTPENDLRNVRGVKALLKTPRTRRSIKNDLTNVSGVKKVFGKSPKNRLSDVRVKELFAKSPKDDLRRVSGVKSLFQSQKKTKSPKNDLSDVRGVKSLFKRKSPVNDLRRVSGVKRVIRRGSPNNDLRDVRGVKQVFRQEKQRNDLNDVSGIEELFNESDVSARDSESLFDKLFGKPSVKAVYSKSLVKKASQKSKARVAKSLHSSIDKITANVEDWLEQELKKRFIAHDKSKNSSLNRVLQNLATATVEGVDPIRNSRSRLSAQNISGKTYSETSLPIKKRSLVGVGSETSLPLKKRIVVHSTPVKGRRVTLASSGLGRVSPIAPASGDSLLLGSIRTEKDDTQLQPEPQPEPKTKAKRNTKPKVDAVLVEKPPSPRKTRGTIYTSPKSRATRGRKTEIAKTNAKKSRPSLTVPKKSPILSPKPRTRRGKKDDIEKQVEPPKPVRNRKQPQVKSKGAKTLVEQSLTTALKETPRRTRAKPERVTVVINKPSPKLKPAKNIMPPQRRTRKTAAPKITENAKKRKIESPKPTTKKDKKPTKTEKPEPVTGIVKKRGQTLAKEIEPRIQKTETKSRKKVESQEIISETITRSRRNAANIPEVNTRKRKGTAEEIVPAKITKTKAVKGKVDIVVTETKGVKEKRSVKSKVEVMEIGANTRVVRSKKVVVTAVVTKQSEPKTTRRRKAVEPVEEVPKTNTRKRKIDSKEAPKKSPARKTAQASPVKGRATRATANKTDVPSKTTGRSRRR